MVKCDFCSCENYTVEQVICLCGKNCNPDLEMYLCLRCTLALKEIDEKYSDNAEAAMHQIKNLFFHVWGKY